MLTTLTCRAAAALNYNHLHLFPHLAVVEVAVRYCLVLQALHWLPVLAAACNTDSKPHSSDIHPTRRMDQLHPQDFQHPRPERHSIANTAMHSRWLHRAQPKSLAALQGQKLHQAEGRRDFGFAEESLMIRHRSRTERRSLDIAAVRMIAAEGSL